MGAGKRYDVERVDKFSRHASPISVACLLILTLFKRRHERAQNATRVLRVL